MNRKRIIIKLLMIIFLVGIIVSSINIFLWYKDNQKNKEIMEELDKNIEIIDNSFKNNKDEQREEYIINFDNLKNKNSDTVGYIKLNGTNINHVIVKGYDNKYYLNHNFNKEYNRSGWIFMDYRDKLDGNDRNIIIYGHNMNDESMFGTLKNVLTKEWYNNTDNHIISLVLNDKTIYYQVFSTYTISVEDYYIQTYFKDNTSFNNFINILRKRSIYNYGITVSGEDHILTLSTCNNTGKKRVVLHAKEIVVNRE